jgi:hypothetical protein
MRTLIFCFAALAMTAPAYTQTAPPAAPSVTAGAEFKGLRFDWSPVPGASWYQFEYRAHATSAFAQQGANLPASATSTRLRLPLHLFDWTFARYRVAACNSAGCTRSSEVSVSNLRLDAVGYFKASQSLIGIRFGEDTDISPDGLNFVAAAPGDFIYDNNTTSAGGAIYVFRRASNGTWAQRARLTPPVPPFIEGSNEMKVAISADGNTVAVGMPNYFSEEFDVQSGEVFVYRFNGTTWTRTRLASGNRGMFGRWIGLNDAGDTLAVGTGDNIEPTTPRMVAIYRLTNGTWTPVRALREGANEFCQGGVFSRDGSTVVEQCANASGADFLRIHSGANWTVREYIVMTMSTPSDLGYALFGMGVSANGETIAAQIRVNHGPDPDTGPVEVQVYKRVAGIYNRTGTLTPGAWRDAVQRGNYGRSVAVSGDGGTIAVGDPNDNGFGTGPRAAPLNPDPNRRAGAVYIYRAGNTWNLANMVKPNVAFTSASTWGHEVSLNANGQTLLIGFPTDCSDADGIDGNWNNCNGNGGASGAVFLY